MTQVEALADLPAREILQNFMLTSEWSKEEKPVLEP